MTRDFALLMTLTVVGAVLLLVHVALLARAVRAKQLRREWRLAALLPPLTPVVAWKAGARALALLWAALLISNAILRSVA
jgi:hypothetical protein